MSFPLNDDKIKINDIVHGQMEFESYLQEIIASEEFQRLRNVKQLGSAFMAYESSTCSRYEHSLGVCHLANKLIGTLQLNNPEIKISTFYRKCVTIAGLLHDLGHGPYSHMWEHLMEVYFKQTYHHENISCLLAERVLSRIPNVFENDAEKKRGIHLIQCLIRGNLNELQKELGPDMYVAEIICNKFSEIDVDRVDYILRDFRQLGHAVNIVNFEQTFHEFLERAYIIEGPDHVKHINYSKDDLKRIYCLFKNRIELHKQIYQSPNVVGTQILLCEFFKAADDNHFKFNGRLRLNEVTNGTDLTPFTTFDDTILEKIQTKLTNTSTSPKYEILKDYIVNKKRFRLINEDEYNELRNSRNYGDENFRTHTREIEHPFRKFKIFLDRHLLYNGNYNRVVNKIDEVKQFLNLDVNRELDSVKDIDKFYYFVET